MTNWRYFRARTLGGDTPAWTVGRHDADLAADNCDLLHADEQWRASDLLYRLRRGGHEVPWLFAGRAPTATPARPRAWQYFTVAYHDGDEFVPAATAYGRRPAGEDTDADDDLYCELLAPDGRWHASQWRSRERFVGDDGVVADVSPEQMFQLILRAQALTPGGLFEALPAEPADA